MKIKNEARQAKLLGNRSALTIKVVIRVRF